MAHATSSTATNQSPETPSAQFTFTLDIPETQALLAIVGLTRGQTLFPLYKSLEDFHEEHDIDRKEVAEEHNIRGFDEDALVDWGTQAEAMEG